MSNYHHSRAIWSVAVLSPPYKSLVYQEPEYFSAQTWTPGLRVTVPMGRGDVLRVGVLETHVPMGPLKKLKDIHWPLEREPLISREYLEMILELSKRHLVPLARILASVLPEGLRRLPDALVIKGSGQKVPFPGPGSDKRHLKDLADSWMAGEADFFSRSRVSQKIISVAKDPPWPILPNAKLQWKIMDLLWEQGEVTGSHLRKVFGPQVGTSIKSLTDKGLVRVQIQNPEGGQARACSGKRIDYELTPDQQEALSFFLPKLGKRVFDVSVLHGITGSGKSIVYLNLARECLEKGRSAVILAPEIAIAAQLYALICTSLPSSRVFLHHGLKGSKDKESLFLALSRSEEPIILVGTRSALFMPLQNVGLIILDEEHDESFKQDQVFVYQAKEIAHYLAKRDDSVLILGSATPDVKSFYAAREKKVNLVTMNSRVGKSILPRVSFVDLKKDPPGFGPLSSRCEKALKETLGRGEQAIIMHNRRGYSPIIMCSDCSEIARCSECKVSLTLHKQRQRLVCHYCGKSLPFSIFCENCRGAEFVPVGDGTEKIEEFFIEKLKDINVLRLDRDSARNPARTEEILDAFAGNRAQVLVGTQMLSKGHTFPNVTLCIVLDGDLGLGLPDYRSSERTFQLLVQLSGRAGRGDKPGQVFIQTRNPEHFCWQFVAASDYHGFFEQELSRRRLFGYPPFVRLGLIRLSVPAGWSKGENLLSELRRFSPGIADKFGVRLLGPAAAPLSRLKNRDRYQFLVKARDWTSIKHVYCQLEPFWKKHRNIRASLDLDPMNML
ncbi:replication restart helicase PriA [Desulfonatronovibrio hydrogenovorans]|uniref:replication restart helicase PriA n=1 Tax=Desulfonatronovibrio hydrogenovorans TaxID=53245 RepID=UPI000550F715|nr:primosomal protein N' [Desulfonatronovibrio hydrogenovorans]